MKTFIALALFFILFVVCWPLAIIMLFLFPFVWLILLPFRIIGLTIEGIFNLIRVIFMLPFRLVKAI
jgi:hypothetical protein